MKKKTILIGPTGFLGPAFLKMDPSILAVGRSGLPEDVYNEFIKIGSDLDFSPLDNVDFENVIFLIGSSDHKILNAHPTMALEKNVLALASLLTYLKTSGRKINKVINFTTMLQYDSLKMIIPCDEEQPRNPSINNYVMSKYVSELITAQYRDSFPIIDVRISNVYGPTKLYRPDIVPSLIWSILETGNASVWNKSPKRDFIFVEDAVNAVLKLIETDYSGPVNLGSGVSSSVFELCGHLERLAGISINDEAIPVSGHMDFCQDISLVKSITDWEPQFNLGNGLEKTFKEMQLFYKSMLLVK
jgi:nucleoside-diphosphate-sugar epimerase